MKKFTFTLLLNAVALIVFAQSSRPQVAPHLKNAAPISMEAPIPSTGFEKLNVQASVPPAENMMFDNFIGSTGYDLQTNAGMASRVVQHPDGRTSAVWTQSQQTGAWSDRGTGYNTSDATHTFPANTDMRIEDIRTGFTSICVTEDGTEHVFAHSSDYVIIHSSKAPGASTWTQTPVPHQTTIGGLWPRCAAQGNTIHMLYLTRPVSFGGTLYNGLDGTPVYCRSTDGGVTWDQIDVTLPGLDTDRFVSLDPDQYYVTANGNNVAIGLFTRLGDNLVINSDDNGDSWTMSVVYDFPFPRYAFGDSINIPIQTDTLFYPDSFAVFGCNGGGTLLIDDNGITHYWMSTMFFTDNDFTDGLISVFSNADVGIVYWNSTMDAKDVSNAPSFIIAGYPPDLDGDNLWGHPDQTDFYNEYSNFFANSVHPSAGMDANGRLYLTFNAPNELNFNENNGTLFRDAFVSTNAITDFSVWTDPIPVANEFNSDFGLASFQERIYPAMASLVLDSLCVIQQVDYVQGTNTNQGTTEISQVNFYALPIDVFPPVIVGTSQAVRNDIALHMFPNPAVNQTNVRFALETGVQGNLVVMDMSGRLVQRTTTRHFNAGDNNVTLDISSLSTGIYMVQLSTENFISTQKLVVAK